MENFFKNYKICNQCPLMDTCPLGWTPIADNCNTRLKFLIDTLIKFKNEGVELDTKSLVERFSNFDLWKDN